VFFLSLLNEYNRNYWLFCFLLNISFFLDEGYDIRTPSMDSKLEFFERDREEIIEPLEVSIELPVVLEIDAILDKIGRYGIESITVEEKNFLDNQ